MDRFSALLEIVMKLRSEMVGDATNRLFTDIISEQQACAFSFGDPFLWMDNFDFSFFNVFCILAAS